MEQSTTPNKIEIEYGGTWIVSKEFILPTL